MDKLNQYRQLIKSIILEHAEHKPSVGDVEVETVFDEVNDHYQLLHSGWSGIYRIHGSVIHIDIRNGKVWIQHNGTEELIAQRLVDAGVPRSDIVLAFKHPSMRPDTEFAIA